MCGIITRSIASMRKRYAAGVQRYKPFLPQSGYVTAARPAAVDSSTNLIASTPQLHTCNSIRSAVGQGLNPASRKFLSSVERPNTRVPTSSVCRKPGTETSHDKLLVINTRRGHRLFSLIPSLCSGLTAGFAAVG